MHRNNLDFRLGRDARSRNSRQDSRIKEGLKRFWRLPEIEDMETFFVDRGGVKKTLSLIHI